MICTYVEENGELPAPYNPLPKKEDESEGEEEEEKELENLDGYNFDEPPRLFKKKVILAPKDSKNE